MQELNIVELIEKNPISKLSKAYNNKLINKIKINFNSFEQQLFVSSFYCYLNYDKNIDFVVDLDNIWKWLGFTQKVSAERVIEKQFKFEIDYINFEVKQDLGKTALQFGKASLESHGKSLANLAFPLEKASLESDKKSLEKTALLLPKASFKQNGGQNIKKIMLTIKCFKSLCLKAQTKKASEIHEYYMKMEETLHEIVEEETDELRLQLEQKDNTILEIKQSSEQEKHQLLQSSEQEKHQLLQSSKKEKQKAVEQAIIVQFPVNTECIYFGTIDNTNEEGEKLIKFGHTNDLATRIVDHHKKYINFILVNAFRVQNKVEIENLIKTYPKIKRQIRSIEINGKNKTEIIAYDATNFTIEKLSKHIKDIIHSKTYSIDNFNRIMKENEELQNENREIKEQLKNNKILIEKQAIEIIELKEKINNHKKVIDSVNVENQSVYQNVLLPEDELNTKFNEFVNSICIVRSDVEELSVNIEGRYRLWSQVKPSKEVFHALKNYMDTRFKPKRIQGSHGYLGIKLKSVEYKKYKKIHQLKHLYFKYVNFQIVEKF